MDRRDIARLLLERGAKVNLSEPGIDTPLITSIKHARRDIAKILRITACKVCVKLRMSRLKS
jgi:ankyrin repeat protein